MIDKIGESLFESVSRYEEDSHEEQDHTCTKINSTQNETLGRLN